MKRKLYTIGAIGMTVYCVGTNIYLFSRKETQIHDTPEQLPRYSNNFKPLYYVSGTSDSSVASVKY